MAKVGEKIFAFLSGGASIGLKCGTREQADLLVDRYAGSVRPMAYIGRYGWNSITLDETIPDDEVAELIDASYAMVVAKLPRAQRPG